MTITQILSLAPAPALLFAALQDVASRRVPDWVSAVIVACGMAARITAGDAISSILLASAVFAALFACWRCGWLGGGDVKLLTACTLLVPAGVVPDLILAIAVAGGVLSVAYLLGRPHLLGRNSTVALHVAAPSSVIRRICRVEGWRIRRSAPLPYACAIVAGCLFTLVAG